MATTVHASGRGAAVASAVAVATATDDAAGVADCIGGSVPGAAAEGEGEAVGLAQAARSAAAAPKVSRRDGRESEVGRKGIIATLQNEAPEMSLVQGARKHARRATMDLVRAPKHSTHPRRGFILVKVCCESECS